MSCPTCTSAGCAGCIPPPGVQCVGCDTWYPQGSRCQRCVTCARCQATVAVSETIVTVRGSTICAPCRRAYYWRCVDCNGWNRSGSDCRNGCTDDNDRCEPYCDCDSCRDDADNDLAGMIHRYEYKPVPVFYGTGPLYLGAEIEVQTPYDRTPACARLANDYLGELGYLKSDSSIGHGFEIVTHPMSYPWAAEHFPWPMLTRLAASGCEATRNTGIHVHLSRTGFSGSCHTYRWMKFIYRNEAQVTILAGRSCDAYAAFDDYDRRAVKDYARGTAVSNRYRAINTINHDTLELRIFASSLDPDRVKAILGFAAASVEYTRQLTAHTIATAGGWTWAAFVTWLADKPAYHTLTNVLEALACVC